MAARGLGSSVKPNNRTSTRYEKKGKKINVPNSELDQSSTSPTYSEELCFMPCSYHAPFFAYCKHDKTYAVTQGCCNHWDCPRCGQLRAKHEYGRIVEGIRTLGATDQIWFITVTCRGRGLTVKESEKHYGEWTNTLLDAWRLQSKRIGKKWAYVQVTERQTRGHPHSHILTTFCPSDVAVDWKKERVQVDGRQFMAYVSALRSEYIQQSVIRSGMGEQYDITPAGKLEAVSRYVAKYLFKDNIFNDQWPKDWRRVRYSQSFPKRGRKESDAFVLLKRDDWHKLESLAVVVSCRDIASLEEAQFWLRGSDVVLLNK